MHQKLSFEFSRLKTKLDMINSGQICLLFAFYLVRIKKYFFFFYLKELNILLEQSLLTAGKNYTVSWKLQFFSEICLDHSKLSNHIN